MYIQVLGVTPGDTEYLAISCYECRKIRLVDLDLQYVTLGYTHHRYRPGYMIPGDDHTIFVHMVDSEVVVELAYYSWGSSSLVQVTRTETPGVSARCSTFCYIPRPKRLLVMYLESRMLLQAFSVDENAPVWTRTCEIQDTFFHPKKMLVNSDKNLVVFDETFKRILIMNPNNSSYLQILSPPVMLLWLQDMLWCNSGLVLMHSEKAPGRASGNYKLIQLELEDFMTTVSDEPSEVVSVEPSAPPEVILPDPSAPPEVILPDPLVSPEDLPADLASPEVLRDDASALLDLLSPEYVTQNSLSVNHVSDVSIFM